MARPATSKTNSAKDAHAAPNEDALIIARPHSKSTEEDAEERRKYASPPCYLPDFEQDECGDSSAE